MRIIYVITILKQCKKIYYKRLEKNFNIKAIHRSKMLLRKKSEIMFNRKFL